MAARNKPYEQFGPFVLFKKLESDALTDLWRAAPIENGSLGALVALRRFHGGNRQALLAAAATASKVVPVLSGTSFVRHQVIDAVGDVPYISHEYAGGRSLRHIVDRARGGTGSSAHPIPLDQAIAIAEKVALSLATMADLKFGGERLTHGALIPQFIWISDDGEIRVAGQQLGAGLIPSLTNGAVASEIGRYFAPEYQASGQPTKASEVFSLGAVLYLLVTGLEPPDVAGSGFSLAIRGSKTSMGTAMPDDIRSILEKSLAVDPSARYATVADMKTAISALTSSGRYTATTFNLAFYLSTLLKKEIDSEAIERERETKLNVAPYLQTEPAPVPVVAAPSPVHVAVAATTSPKTKKKFPLAVAAAAAVVAIGAGAWVTLGAKKAPVASASSQPQLASALTPAVAKPIVAPEPIVASATPDAAVAESTPATATQVDEAARKKAFEEAVKEQLQEELLKLQAEYTKQLQRQQARNAPVLGVTATAAPAAAPQQEQIADNAPSAAELDAARRENQRAQQPVVQQTAVPEPVTQTQPALTTQAPAPAPAVVQAPAIREGDVVDLASVDTPPRVTREARPVYPVVAARQKIVATILTTILVSETGEVLEVKVLRGEPRFGFNEAASRALRAARYSPAMKDGKRVKTWLPQIIQFKP